MAKRTTIETWEKHHWAAHAVNEWTETRMVFVRRLAGKRTRRTFTGTQDRDEATTVAKLKADGFELVFSA